MTQQEELRVVLRTIADTNGATQVRRALGDVQAQAQRTSGGIVLKTVADTRGADQVRRSLADVRAQSQAHPPTVLRMTADMRGADQVRRELAYVRRALADVQTQAQRTQGGIALKTIADTRGADQIRRSLVDVQTQAQRTSGPGGIVLRTVAQTQGADQVRRSLTQVRQEAQRTKELGLGNTFDSGGQGALRFAAALTGVTIGLSLAAAAGNLIRQSLNADAFIAAQRTARATAAAYGEAAGSFTKFAVALSAQTGFTRDAILEAALSARTLSENYGLTIQQTQKLIMVSADLANVRGIGVAEAFERVQSAIRGEAEASEFLGLTLNATFLQQNAQNGALRTTFTTLTDAQRAQVVYGEVLRQTANFTGLAAEGNKGLEGAQRRAQLATQEFAQDLGQLLSRQLEISADQFAKATRAADEFVKTLNEGSGEERQARRALATRTEIGKLLEQVGITQSRFGLLADAASGKMVNLEEIADRLGVSWDDLIAVMEAGQDKFSGSAEGLDLVRTAVLKLHPAVVQIAESMRVFDEARRSANLGTDRWISDLDDLGRAISNADRLIASLGESAETATQSASLSAENDLRKVLAAQNALEIAGRTSLRTQLETKSTTDPGNRHVDREALAQIAVLDQLEAANRDLLALRDEGRDIQREQRDLAIEEANRVQAMLPARQAIAAIERQITDQVDQRLRLQQEAAHIAAEQRAAPAQNALEDTQSGIARARLVLADRRNQTPEARTEARSTIRNAARNVLPGQELAAFDANQGIRGVEREQRATDLSTRAAQNPLQQRQVELQALIRPAEDSLIVLREQGERLDNLARIAASQVDRQVEIKEAIIASAVADATRAKEALVDKLLPQRQEVFEGSSAIPAVRQEAERQAAPANIVAARTSEHEARLEAIIERGVKEFAAAANQPAQVQLVVKGDDGTVLIDELIEGNAAAQTPSVIQLSGVRR